MLIRSRVADFATRFYRSRAGLWFPEHDVVVALNQNVLAVLDGPEGKRVVPGHNIVTDDGDQYYAQRGASEAITNNDYGLATSIMEMQSAGTPGKTATRASFTAIAGSQKVYESTPQYPLTNDVDADNTGTVGTDVVTYLTSYTKADFSAVSITHGIITVTAPAAGEDILTGYAFSPAFAKTANDSLKVFVNHEMLGV